MNLIIVESPTKAKTISRFLGDDFIVKSSFGHVRDLPEKKLGIDIKNNFKPEYVIPSKAKKTISELKKASLAKKVILATDEDREGEAIAWHLIQALGLENSKFEIRNSKLPKVERIVFHEITKNAVEEALKNPREINQDLVDAQQARRILDRLVGYKLSPFLWKKIAKGLSAGRVQSVAVRLIVEREQTIRNFKPEKYWTVSALLETKNQKEKFEALLIKIRNKTIEKPGLKDENEVKKIVAHLEKALWQITEIKQQDLKRSPLPPFTTSTLQQTAWQKFHWSSKQTMVIAQQLYEGIELAHEDGPVGLITYMRTDSLNLSNEALKAAQQKLEKVFGREFTLNTPRLFKTKSKNAQEAHEAIRPTDPDRSPEDIKVHLDPRQFKLYDLIWRRFMASQMTEAVFAKTTIDIKALNYLFRASGSTLKWPGFLKVYPMQFEENQLPALKLGENLQLLKLNPQNHETQPPPRFNEATLIKALEEFGIGRPSTYAPTISTIQTRKYVEKDEQRRFIPTDIGVLVNNLLVEHFPKIVDLEFTANIEEDLDEIARGKKHWQPVIKEFWVPFEKNLKEKEKEVSKKELTLQKTEWRCPECGGNLVTRISRFGKFYACSNFPKCRYTRPLEKPDNSVNDQNGQKMICSKCNEGHIVKRRTKKGRIFYGCSRWPRCDWASWQKPQQEENKE